MKHKSKTGKCAATCKYIGKARLIPAKVNNPQHKYTMVKTQELSRVMRELDDMKVVLGEVLTEGRNPKKGLISKTVSAKVKNSVLQETARNQLHEICTEYARNLAKGIGSGTNPNIFYDLTWNTLYSKFKKHSPNRIDIKARADKQSTKLGHKVSALQVAQEQGLAIELLKLAKELFATNNK